MSRTGNQHLVSRTLLRRWCVEKKVRVVYLLTGRTKLIATKGVAYSTSLVPSTIVDEAERRWGMVENQAGGALAKVANGTLFECEEDVTAIKQLIGLQLLRSYESVRLWGDAITTNERARNLARLLQNDDFVRGYHRDRTGASTGTFDLAAERRLMSRDVDAEIHEAFANTVLENLDPVLEHCSQLRLTIRTPVDKLELVIGDTPAFTLSADGTLVGLENGISIGSAAHIMLPVGPYALASLAADDGAHELLDADVEQANLIQYMRARTQVFVRPGSKLEDWVLARRQEDLADTDE